MNIRIIGADELGKNLDRYASRMVIALKKVINTNSFILKTHVAQDLIKFAPGLFGGGTSDTTLASRSGQFKRSIAVQPVEVDGKSVRGGMSFGTRYAKVHVGPRGQSMTIVPRSAKMLAIPLPAAQGPHGQGLGGPRDTAKFGETFIAKSRKGNLIIFGKGVYQKGARVGQTKGKIVPLFLLRRSVTVKTRIHPEDLIKWIEPKLQKDLDAMKVEA